MAVWAESRTRTVASTLIPGRSTCSGSGAWASTIFTGTRWVTLTKLPVELSGGRRATRSLRGARDRLNLAAEDDAREAVGLELDVLARLHVGQLGFLEVRDDPDFGLGRDREKRLARLDELAGFDVLP